MARINIFKTWLLFSLFLILIISIGWFFSYIYQSPNILFIAVIFSVITSISSYWFSDKLALAMSGAKKIEKGEYPEIYQLIENLCRKVSLPMPKIYIVEEMTPNAFATGRNSKHSVVAVTRGLIQRLNKEELEGVIAHELSHIKNKDMLLSTVAVVLAGFISLVSDFFIRSIIFGSFRRNNDSNNAGLGLIIIGVVTAIIAPLGAMLIRLAISRKREFLADISGAGITGNPEGLASALEKIHNAPSKMKTASVATAHLWISNPLSNRKLFNLFMTHPPIEERIKILRNL